MVCNTFFSKISSCFTRDSIRRAAIVTVPSAVSCYLCGAGVLGGIVTFGTLFAAYHNLSPGNNLRDRSQLTTKNLDFLRGYNPPAALETERTVFHEEKKAREIYFAKDLLLEPQAKAPPKIVWEGNSCFVSSAMWSFFLNEPAVLREIPNAIIRRLPLASRHLLNLVQSGRFNLVDLNDRMNQVKDGKQPIDAELMQGLLQALQESHEPRLAELVSLLELHQLISFCQKNESVPGAYINEVRHMVKRVDGQFQDMGTRTGDAHEVIIALGNMIFEGSPYHQSENTLRHCQPYAPAKYSLNPQAFEDEEPYLGGFYSSQSKTYRTERYQLSRSYNWGHIAITVGPQNLSVKQILKNHTSESRIGLDQAPKYDAFDTEGIWMREKRYFDTTEQLLLDEPPQVLVLNFKNPAVTKNVEEVLEIREEDGIFKRGKAKYLLTAVSRHGLDFAHYDTTVRAADGQIYYCNDMSHDRPLSCDSSRLKESGKTGYILIYRKIQ